MKTYWSCVLGLFMVAGLSGIASAITDPGTNYGPTDLTEATVEVYERADTVEILALSYTNTPNLPGAIILECDVDDSTGTGGSISTIGTPVLPCPCKTEPGFDIAIAAYHRRQGDASGSAFCASCTDGVGACERRREAGEWYAVPSLSGQPQRAIGILRGLLDPVPKAPTSTVTKATLWFPWNLIKAYVHENTAGNPKQFNWTKSGDPLNNKWQISTWYDDVAGYALDEDDVSSAGPIFDINDYAPDAGKAPTTIQVNPCEGNFDGPNDQDVDGTDAASFKRDFGRSSYCGSSPFHMSCVGCNPYPGPITY